MLGALWAFYVTYGFTLTFTWFIINSVKALDEGTSLSKVSLEVAKNAIYVFVYLTVGTIFTFSTRKTLPYGPLYSSYWFERMLYSPA